MNTMYFVVKFVLLMEKLILEMPTHFQDFSLNKRAVLSIKFLLEFFFVFGEFCQVCSSTRLLPFFLHTCSLLGN